MLPVSEQQPSPEPSELVRQWARIESRGPTTEHDLLRDTRRPTRLLGGEVIALFGHVPTLAGGSHEWW